MLSRFDRNQPLRKLFGGFVDDVFHAQLGVCNPRLTEYLGDMLMEFVHVDVIYRFHAVDGEQIREISRIEADAYLGPHAKPSERTRVINRYIGDFTLFWTGVYPEVLRRRNTDRLHEYVLRGKRSYGVASELSTPDSEPSPELLRQLSNEFECCVHGLHLVREGWRQMRELDGTN